MDTMLTERRRTVTEAERALLMARLREGLLTRPEIVFAYLHGSFVTGRPFHDVRSGDDRIRGVPNGRCRAPSP